MTAKDLKASILQLAIQGKLVPQDPTDEPASALLARIRDSRVEVEKCRKTGTRGRAKTPASPQPILDDDLSSVALAKEEKPFGLPEGWAWCRLGEIVNIVSARRVHQSDWKTSGVPFYRAREIVRLSESGVADNELYISEELFAEFSKSGCPQPGDLMVTAVGTIGTCYIVRPGDRFYYKDATVLCFENVGRISAEYMLHLMHSPYMHDLMHSKSAGTTVDTITMVKANQYPIPLPPLAEQKRIVAKIEELMPMVERYGTVKEQSDALEAALPDAFRKSVLQYAIQGKLVPQDPNDEPASALLERIAAVRNAVTPRKGRARTPAAPQPIPEDEQPFDLPEGWAWCRLGELGVTNIGLTYRPQDVSSNGTPVLRSNNIQNGIIVLDELVRVNIGVPDRAIAHTNDILICARNGSKALVGKSAIVTSEGMAFGAFMTILRTPYYRYVHMFLCSELFRAQLTDSNTTTINQITQDKLKNIVIPLPPLPEQKRIVAEVERLLALGEHLKIAS